MQLIINTAKRQEIIDITSNIKEFVKKEGKTGNACLVYVPHTTCAVILNENYDPDVNQDILDYLNKQVPSGIGKHNEGNSDAHIKTSLIGNAQIIPLEKGELQLGTWQGIGLAEFDGPRKRKIIVKII